MNSDSFEQGCCLDTIGAMGSLIAALLAYTRAFFVTRHRLALEAAALHQQLAVFKRKQTRLRLKRQDRLFWTALRRLYSAWADTLIIVKPETVVSWHRAGFRLFWRWRSRQRGRPKVANEIRELIRRMNVDNPSWGAPRIHGELLLLGFKVSEPTVSRYLRRLKRRRDKDKAKRWLTFLNNHRELIVAFDFFTVPTLMFETLYCFYVIEHGGRRILHFNCTAHPTSDWIVQQLREAHPIPSRTYLWRITGRTSLPRGEHIHPARVVSGYTNDQKFQRFRALVLERVYVIQVDWNRVAFSHWRRFRAAATRDCHRSLPLQHVIHLRHLAVQVGT